MALTPGASAPTPQRVTKHHRFFQVNLRGDLLFCVREDIPAANALEQASNFLDAAVAAVYQAAEASDTAVAYAAAYLTEMAKAIVDAAVIAIGQEQKTNN